MNPESPNGTGWDTIDIGEMLTARDEAGEAHLRGFSGLPIEPSHGYHPDNDEYVIDPDYGEILGLDPSQLIGSKQTMRR